MQTSVHLSGELTSQTPAQIINNFMLKSNITPKPPSIMTYGRSGLGELAGSLVGWLTYGLVDLWVGWWVGG